MSKRYWRTIESDGTLETLKLTVTGFWLWGGEITFDQAVSLIRALELNNAMDSKTAERCIEVLEEISVEKS